MFTSELSGDLQWGKKLRPILNQKNTTAETSVYSQDNTPGPQ